jgi:sec-independent protein translocase protein TatA
MPTLPGGAEWIVILLIVLVLFGGAKLPGLARSVGQSITEFRKASKEGQAEGEDGESSDNASERDSDS